MKIALGCDHGGINLKKEIAKYLESEGYEFKDFGTYTTDSCDYPDYALPVAEAVANKVPGIRAALCSDTFSAHATRQHDDANILTMGERVVGPGLAIDIVKTFLNSSFEGDRHIKRINKITEIEKKYNK